MTSPEVVSESLLPSLQYAHHTSIYSLMKDARIECSSGLCRASALPTLLILGGQTRNSKRVARGDRYVYLVLLERKGNELTITQPVS